MEIKTTAVVKGAKSYACSDVGIIHSAALVCSLVAFVCNESAPWCSGKSYCSPPVYRTTYVYFSVVTLASFLISGVFYILHCTEVYGKLSCNPRRKFICELSCMGAIVFFLVFGNLFMISRIGNRVIYMVSTCLGCLAMASFGGQLALILVRNYSKLIAEGSDSDNADDDDDDVESAIPNYAASELTIQTTAVRQLNISSHSWEALPGMKSCSQASSEISAHIADEESDSASSTSGNQ